MQTLEMCIFLNWTFGHLRYNSRATCKNCRRWIKKRHIISRFRWNYTHFYVHFYTCMAHFRTHDKFAWARFVTSMWTREICRWWVKISHWISAVYVAVRNASGLKASGVEKWGRMSHFLSPSKNMEGWARCLSKKIKLYLRPNLWYTFDGRPLCEYWEEQCHGRTIKFSTT